MDVCQTGVDVRAAACVRAIDRDLSCRVSNDRMKLMVNHRVDCGGKSILELLWDRMMEVYAEVLEQVAAWAEYQESHDPMEFCEEREERITAAFSLKGEALGLATAISILTNPYAPNVDAVREEARKRYEAMG